jgi:hypothetical protein
MVVNSQGNALTSSTFGSSLTLSGNTSLSASNITTGNLPIQQLPQVSIAGVPTVAVPTGSETTQSINTVSGISANQCLFLCGGAVIKPTTIISCPSGWTSLITGGNLTDGTNQSQAVLCSRVVTGTESGSYAVTWTGTATGAASEIAVNGLAQCTSVDGTFKLGNTSAAVNPIIGAPVSGSYSASEFTVLCAQGQGTSGSTTNPLPIVLAGPNSAMLGAGYGVARPLIESSGTVTQIFGGAGVMMH